MVKRYFITLLRRFKQKKIFTLINIGGLTLGITCSLIMFLIVKHEFSYDNYHANGDRLYRIITEQSFNDITRQGVGVPKPLPAAVKEEIAGVEAVTFISHKRFGRFKMTNADGEEREFTENPGMVYVQPNFFDLFSWEWIDGDQKSALERPNTVVIDTENAEKFFPGESPLGKTIRFNDQMDLVVTGLVKQRPKNTDFPFEIFISMATIESKEDMTEWRSTYSDDRCYVLLNKGVSPESINEQFEGMLKKHLGDNPNRTLSLQAISEIHFDEVQGRGNLNYRSVSKGLLYVLIVVCIFMVVTACFNFINMSTAMAVKRAKEIGVRKVLGSTRKQLINGFLLETGAITIFSIVLSLAITERLLPTTVKQLTDLDLSLNLLSDVQLIIYLIGLLVFVTLLAGLYPAWIISAFRPAQVLRGTALNSSDRKMGLRRTLVTFQFVLSQVFIIGTLVALWQMDYIRNVDLGYERDWIVYLDLPDNSEEKLGIWKADLEANSQVNNYSLAATPPFSGSTSSTDANFTNETGDHKITVFLKQADSRYIDTYGLNLIAGEGLLDSDKANRFVVNETFVKNLGVSSPEEALGQTVKINGMSAPISGVVQDFHLSTLKTQIGSVALFNQPQFYRTLGVSFRPGTTDQLSSQLEDTWEKAHPNRQFRMTFFDESIERYYFREKRFSKMLTTFASIAIFICCLGLYGLISYMANQRMKEIGIRKVLGASVLVIARSFSLEFLKLVGVAFVIAAPLAYYSMQGWLNNFVYHIEVGPTIFALGVGVSLVITLLTTGYRSIMAARANPADSLRNE